MNNIREKISTVVETFIEGLDSIEHQFILEQDAFKKKLEIIKKQQEDLKIQSAEQLKNYEIRAEKLNKEIDRFKSLQDEIQKEIDAVKKSKLEHERDNNKLSDSLKNAEAERKIATATRLKLDSAVKNYQEKMNYFRDDQVKLEEKLKLVINRDASNRAKERELLKMGEKLISESQSISIREIELKSNIKSLELEKKRAHV